MIVNATKEYLESYRKLMSDITFYETMKNDAIYNVAGYKSPNLDNDGGNHSVNPDPVGDLVIELEKELAKYDMRIIACRAKMALIDRQLSEMRDVNNEYYKILVYRYKIGLGWQEIADKMYMSYSLATHLHGPALQKFDELFGKSYH